MEFGEFQAVLLDLDGTIYHEDRVLAGAASLLARLEREGRRYACLSNSTMSPGQISRRLEGMGIRVPVEHIYSATEAAAEYVLGKFGSPARVFNLATSGLRELLEGKVEWVEDTDQPCDAVVAGCPSNEYAGEDRQRRALALLRRGAELVGLCADRVFPSPRGLEFGSGAFCAMLSYAAGVSPVFCGKPEKSFFLNLCRKLAVEPGKCVLIGDNPESDVAGAKQFGMKSVLLLTGVTTRQDLAKLPAGLQPDLVIDDLTGLQHRSLK